MLMRPIWIKTKQSLMITKLIFILFHPKNRIMPAQSYFMKKERENTLSSYK